jgi:hypothetical protein
MCTYFGVRCGYQAQHTPIGFIFGLVTVMGSIVGMVMVLNVPMRVVAPEKSIVPWA